MDIAAGLKYFNPSEVDANFLSIKGSIQRTAEEYPGVVW